MHECICSSCKNLKVIIGDQGQAEEYEYIFGFPSENCEDCQKDQCEETCDNYVCDDGEDLLKTVNCSKCGKELKQALDDFDGEIFCIECYLNKS